MHELKNKGAGRPNAGGALGGEYPPHVLMAQSADTRAGLRRCDPISGASPSPDVQISTRMGDHLTRASRGDGSCLVLWGAGNILPP